MLVYGCSLTCSYSICHKTCRWLCRGILMDAHTWSWLFVYRSPEFCNKALILRFGFGSVTSCILRIVTWINCIAHIQWRRSVLVAHSGEMQRLNFNRLSPFHISWQWKMPLGNLRHTLMMIVGIMNNWKLSVLPQRHIYTSKQPFCYWMKHFNTFWLNFYN